ncbi:unnamed protein product [Porites evermanni]|uniref:EF-hand domain-containing protein n=1 Tax=Porites evermanni TaxID=104178 RepID=A0ABN8SE62_9CNID|nr:unnamed protein product [Porites evermanni]
MSFWQSSYQADLSVTGTSSSRHQRPPSGRRGRPSSAPRGGSTKSHIFGVSDTPRQEEPKQNARSSFQGNTSSVHTTPEAPRPSSAHAPNNTAGHGPVNNASVITRAQLDAAKKLAKSNPNYADQPVEVQVFSRSRMGGRKAPQGVPQLNLGNLADDNNQLMQPLTAEGPHLHTPVSNSSIISWGTPLHSSRFHPSPVKSKGDGWQVQQGRAAQSHKKPNGMPDLDLERSQEDGDLKKALHARKNDVNNVSDGVEFEEYPHKVDESDPSYNANNVANQYNRPWSTQPTTQREQAQLKRRQEEEVLHSEKKKDLIVETILVDQLSRAAVSDPQKNINSIPADIGPKERKKMEFYNTSSVITAALVTVVVVIVVETLKELLMTMVLLMAETGSDLSNSSVTGIALVHDIANDNSHGSGSRGSSDSVLILGSNLSFATASQSSLPQSVSAHPVVVFRVSEVDDQARQAHLFESCQTLDEKRSIMERLDNPLSDAELQEQEVLDNVQSMVKRQLQKRAVRTLMGLGQHFRKIDQSGDGLLDQHELQRALETYHITIPDETFNHLWDILDVNGDGFLDYGEFSRGFIGEMNELRKSLVRKVFRKLDPNKNGVISLNNMRKFYCTKKHPKVVSGEVRESEIEESFLRSFELCENKGQVTYAEFEDYYEGVSLGFASDQEFTAMMRNCWGV